MGEAPAPAGFMGDYGELPAWDYQRRAPAGELPGNWEPYGQDAYQEGGAGYQRVPIDRAKTGFTKYTEGNAQIPRPAGGRGADNSTQIAMTGMSKRGTIDKRLLTQQGLQKVNDRRYKTYASSSTAQTRPFAPWEGAIQNDPRKPLAGHYVVWNDTNRDNQWEGGERIVAVDGYRMKRLPNARILAGYIQEIRRNPDADFKDYVKAARGAIYKEKHNGQAKQPSAMAVVGTITGQIYGDILEQLTEYKEAEGSGGKKVVVRFWKEGNKAGQRPPRGLFAKVNSDMYHLAADSTFRDVFKNRPFPNTKAAQKQFSDAIKANAEKYITHAEVLGAINKYAGTNFSAE
jgi:hypothetical protein